MISNLGADSMLYLIVEHGISNIHRASFSALMVMGDSFGRRVRLALGRGRRLNKLLQELLRGNSRRK